MFCFIKLFYIKTIFTCTVAIDAIVQILCFQNKEILSFFITELKLPLERTGDKAMEFMNYSIVNKLSHNGLNQPHFDFFFDLMVTFFIYSFNKQNKINLT